MACAKTSAFPPVQQRIAKLARALPHPARLAILQLLSDRQRRLSGEITAALPLLARTTVSQHLVALRKLGLLRAQANVVALTVTYWLDVEVIREMEQLLGAYLTALGRYPVCDKPACGCVDLSYAA